MKDEFNFLFDENGNNEKNKNNTSDNQDLSGTAEFDFPLDAVSGNEVNLLPLSNEENFDFINGDDVDFATDEEVNENTPGDKDPKHKKTSKQIWATIGKIALSIFLVCVITGSLVLSAFAIYVFGFVDNTIKEDLDELKLDLTTTVYVKDTAGEYVEYQRIHGPENRIWVNLDKVPQDLRDAFVAVEDKRFDSHNGVDWRRTFSAFTNLAFGGDSSFGGSTITQQLIKNLTGDNSRSPMRKIREIMRAREIETRYSKDTIMECYLNTIAFAKGICGVEVASNYYFDKTVSDLTTAECAALAAMVKEPELYRPDKNPDKNKERRTTVLNLMLEQGLIEQQEYDTADAQQLLIVAGNLNEIEVNSFFVDTIIDQVVADLVKTYNFDKTYASKNVFNGGYKIYSTMDSSIQKVMEDTYKDTKSYFNQTSSKKDGTTPESAMTIMDYEGHIVGIVGGKGEKTTNRGLNRALSSPRQPGSTMKPIGSYALALEYNRITYSSILVDEPVAKVDNKDWPLNWFRYYVGSVTVHKALERSFNTIPVKLLNEIGLQKSYDFLTNTLGCRYFDPVNDLNASSLGLGGSSYGMTTTESAAAFAIFGNLGKYYKPTTYTKITDQRGEVVLQEGGAKAAIGEDTATIMNHLLQGVVYGPQGTGGGVASYNSMKAFAKTGTSDSSNDLWLVGGTPYYVASCWYGFDMPETIKSQGIATKLWVAIMKKIHSKLENKEFVDSEFVSSRPYCTQTGLVATNNCPTTATGWYKNSYMPTCTTHSGNASGGVVPDTSSDVSSKEGTSPTSSNVTSTTSTGSSTSSQTTPSTGSSSSTTNSNPKTSSE